jgi:hypothetical protein
LLPACLQTPLLQQQQAASMPAGTEVAVVDYSEDKALMALYLVMSKQQVGRLRAVCGGMEGGCRAERSGRWQLHGGWVVSVAGLPAAWGLGSALLLLGKEAGRQLTKGWAGWLGWQTWPGRISSV